MGYVAYLSGCVKLALQASNLRVQPHDLEDTIAKLYQEPYLIDAIPCGIGIPSLGKNPAFSPTLPDQRISTHNYTNI